MYLLHSKISTSYKATLIESHINSKYICWTLFDVCTKIYTISKTYEYTNNGENKICILEDPSRYFSYYIAKKSMNEMRYQPFLTVWQYFWISDYCYDEEISQYYQNSALQIFGSSLLLILLNKLVTLITENLKKEKKIQQDYYS
jgi:hypothetical protein